MLKNVTSVLLFPLQDKQLYPGSALFEFTSLPSCFVALLARIFLTGYTIAKFGCVVLW